ncbi:sensor histidine kinase [Phytohabitans rumicis]|uniref:sensor histidine kinase n=1 Tax=Phytohabitans rumicis TaxID=1076125 RepID=UPI0031ECEA90
MKLPRWRHWTLRSRLVVVAAALTAVALIVANAAGLLLLRRYLTDQIDDQLVGMSRMAQRERPPPSDSFIEPNPESDPFPSTKFDPYKVMLSFNAEGERVRPRTVDSAISLPDLEAFDKLTERAGGAPYTVQSADGESSWRVVVVSRDSGGVAVAAISLRQVDATADLLLVIDLAVMFIVLLLLGMVAASVVRIGLRPLTQMERTSAEITAGDLSSRVDDADPHTEPGRLGIAINSMLDRIESEVAARTASEQRIRQFVADASHELRTPLTSIRGFAELYRRGGTPPGPVLDETMARIEAEAARMGILVEDLLLLAKLDRQREPQRRPVDLLAIAADTIRDAHARRPDRPVRLAGYGPDEGGFEPVTVLGDEHRLRQVATNLVANALQHTPAQANITVRVGRLGAYQPYRAPAAAVGGALAGQVPIAVLEVVDNGPGVPPEHAGRIFERLYRADPSRTRRNGGSGLGLSIVAAIVSSHGGRVELDTMQGRGSAFRVLLPTGSQSALS